MEDNLAVWSLFNGHTFWLSNSTYGKLCNTNASKYALKYMQKDNQWNKVGTIWILHYSDKPRVRQGNVVTHLKLSGKIAQELGNGQKRLLGVLSIGERMQHCMDYQIP